MIFGRRRTPPHTHQWISVSSDSNYHKTFQSGGKIDQTLVLQRCRCGAHNTYWLDGSWSREELGINDETVRDLMNLLNEVNPDA